MALKTCSAAVGRFAYLPTCLFKCLLGLQTAFMLQFQSLTSRQVLSTGGYSVSEGGKNSGGRENAFHGFPRVFSDVVFLARSGASVKSHAAGGAAHGGNATVVALSRQSPEFVGYELERRGRRSRGA